MNKRQAKSLSPEEKEELIMKYVLVLQRKWEEEESNNESTGNA